MHATGAAPQSLHNSCHVTQHTTNVLQCATHRSTLQTTPNLQFYHTHIHICTPIHTYTHTHSSSHAASCHITLMRSKTARTLQAAPSLVAACCCTWHQHRAAPHKAGGTPFDGVVIDLEGIGERGGRGQQEGDGQQWWRRQSPIGMRNYSADYQHG